MVVVMEERATESADRAGRGAVSSKWAWTCTARPASPARCSGAVGQGHPDPGLIEMLDGVHEVRAHLEPYKLASRTFKPEGTVVTVGDVRIGGDEVIVHGRAVLGRDRDSRCARPRRPCGGRARRSSAAARSSRAARHTASRAWARKGCGCCATPPAAENLALVSEVMDVSQIEVDREATRHLPGRRAQHAELHAAARAGPRAQAGAAQARHLGDDRGVAAVGRVHPERRQHRRHPLRARHPHVRDGDAQHASTSRRFRSSRS